MPSFDTAELLDRDVQDRLEQANTRPVWEVIDEMGDRDRRGLEPVIWKGEELRALQREVENVPRSVADELPYERRALIPVNPEYRLSLCPTLMFGLQSFPPGDRAKPHRHAHTAPRFIIDGGEGVKTIVGGEAFEGHDYDLIMTPSGAWHGHANDSDERAMWLSILDQTFVMEALGLTERELFGDGDWTYRPQGYYASQYGTLRPTTRPEPGRGRDGDGPVPYRFAWTECYEILRRAAADPDSGAHDPHDGVCLEYVNVATGQPPIAPTMSIRLQLLDDGTETESHAHNAFEAYYVIQGEGTTHVDDRTLEWEAGDIVFVPAFADHAHASEAAESVLLGVSDRPLLEAFDLYEEQAE